MLLLLLLLVGVFQYVSSGYFGIVDDAPTNQAALGVLSDVVEKRLSAFAPLLSMDPCRVADKPGFKLHRLGLLGTSLRSIPTPDPTVGEHSVRACSVPFAGTVIFHDTYLKAAPGREMSHTFQDVSRVDLTEVEWKRGGGGGVSRMHLEIGRRNAAALQLASQKDEAHEQHQWTVRAILSSRGEYSLGCVTGL